MECIRVIRQQLGIGEQAAISVLHKVPISGIARRIMNNVRYKEDFLPNDEIDCIERFGFIHIGVLVERIIRINAIGGDGWANPARMMDDIDSGKRCFTQTHARPARTLRAGLSGGMGHLTSRSHPFRVPIAIMKHDHIGATIEKNLSMFLQSLKCPRKLTTVIGRFKTVEIVFIEATEMHDANPLARSTLMTHIHCITCRNGDLRAQSNIDL